MFGDGQTIWPGGSRPHHILWLRRELQLITAAVQTNQAPSRKHVSCKRLHSCSIARTRTVQSAVPYRLARCGGRLHARIAMGGHAETIYRCLDWYTGEEAAERPLHRGHARPEYSTGPLYVLWSLASSVTCRHMLALIKRNTNLKLKWCRQCRRSSSSSVIPRSREAQSILTPLGPHGSQKELYKA